MNNVKKSSVKPLVIAIIGIVAALTGALLAQVFISPLPLALATGTLLQPPKAIPNFALLDQDSQSFTEKNLQGRWSLLFFGFTNCPDVCPTTLTTLALVEKNLAYLPPEKKPRVTFVTADAQRDTPEQLKKYVQFFNPDFIGITGTQPALEAFAQSLSAPVALRPVPGGGYTVDHSAAIFVVDPQGALRAIFSGPHQSDALTADLQVLLGAS